MRFRYVSLLLASAIAIPSGFAADEPLPENAGPVLIHELSAGDQTVTDEDGDTVDWLELHNQSESAVSLSGWLLMDDPDQETAWVFPDVTVESGGFLLVHASGKDRRDPAQPLHTHFKLNAAGEYLALTQPDGTISHAFDPEFPQQRQGMTYGLTDKGAFRYFATATPGMANTGSGVCFVADTKFSVDRGYFNEPIQVEITSATPDVVIRYTTDGNEPSAGTLFGGAVGAIYDGPITIDRTTILRAQATRSGWQPSNIDTQTYLFLEDIVRQSPNGEVPPGWPESSVNGQRFDFGMDPEVVDDSAYADQIVPALLELPAMSLVMDHEGLTSRRDGIYVNASQDGPAWERPGSLELLHPSGEKGFQIDAGVRIRGGFSRAGNNPKHSFRLFFREEYGGTLRYRLFGNEGNDWFKKLDFRTAQNYAWSLDSFNDARRNTFLREIFARDSQRALGYPYTRSRYYHLFLNGQYWGLYMSQERAGADYAESYFGGTDDQYDVIKVEAGPYTVYATTGSIDAFNELHELVSGELTDADFHALQGKNPQGQDDPSLTKHIDVENLINYMMIIFYIGSFDAPLAGTDRANNFYAVRNRETRDGWRFFCHDTEHSMMNVVENRMGPYPAGRSRQHFNPQYLHQQLMQSDAYRLAFADHARKAFFGEGVFTVVSARKRWLARQNEIQLAIIAESARWGDQHESTPYTKADWLKETEWMLETYISQRTEIVYEQMEKAGLTGDLLLPEFRPDGGLIDDPDTFQFKFQVGTLFKRQDGEIYYTLDGSDPKNPDGSVSASAIAYDRQGSGASLGMTATVRARLLHEGSWSPINEATFLAGGELASPENLVISEIMYRPEGGSAYEYLELWNPSDTAVDLTGAYFSDGLNFTIPGVALGPGERAVLVSEETAFLERYGAVRPILGAFGGEEGSRLNNGGELLTLRNIKKQVVTQFRYNDGGDWPSEADGEGASLKLTGTDPNIAASWKAEPNPLGVQGGDSPAADTLLLSRTDQGLIRLTLPNAITTDIEYSEDLRQWEVIATEQNGTFDEADVMRRNRNRGYYRLKP